LRPEKLPNLSYILQGQFENQLLNQKLD
jgi:hypothetical protein